MSSNADQLIASRNPAEAASQRAPLAGHSHLITADQSGNVRPGDVREDVLPDTMILASSPALDLNIPANYSATVFDWQLPLENPIDLSLPAHFDSSARLECYEGHANDPVGFKAAIKGLVAQFDRYVAQSGGNLEAVIGVYTAYTAMAVALNHSEPEASSYFCCVTVTPESVPHLKFVHIPLVDLVVSCFSSIEEYRPTIRYQLADDVPLSGNSNRSRRINHQPPRINTSIRHKRPDGTPYTPTTPAPASGSATQSTPATIAAPTGSTNPTGGLAAGVGAAQGGDKPIPKITNSRKLDAPFATPPAMAGKLGVKRGFVLADLVEAHNREITPDVETASLFGESIGIVDARSTHWTGTMGFFVYLKDKNGQCNMIQSSTLEASLTQNRYHDASRR